MLLYAILSRNIISSGNYLILNIINICCLVLKNFFHLLNWVNKILIRGIALKPKIKISSLALLAEVNSCPCFVSGSDAANRSCSASVKTATSCRGTPMQSKVTSNPYYYVLVPLHVINCLIVPRLGDKATREISPLALRIKPVASTMAD